MKPRELLGNVLLALVANPLTAMEWIRVSTDRFNADGLVRNDARGEMWLMEHVFVPGPYVALRSSGLTSFAVALGRDVSRLPPHLPKPVVRADIYPLEAEGAELGRNSAG